MVDIFLETVRSVVLLGIVIYLWNAGRSKFKNNRKGWNIIIGGFGLLLLGSILDVTDNYEELNRFVVIGDTPTEALLEKFVGFLGGFVLLAIGLIRWIPGVQQLSDEIDYRKLAEEKLIKTQIELQVKADELQQALAKEKELSKIQREFVSMASHEFRTPLAIIDMTAQRMKSRADTNRLTPEDAVKRIEKIRGAVQRMTRLMESTLDAARMEEGKIEIIIEPCDIGKIVREICARHQEISNAHVISCDLAELSVAIQADTSSVGQVLTNLLSNAVKYAPDAPDIEVVGRKEGDQVMISVRDHGIGIDEDELDRIGERFFRAKTSIGIAGTGIGLSLAKTLVEMHDGSFSVESQKGEGSTFTIRLPIAGPDLSQQLETSAA